MHDFDFAVKNKHRNIKLLNDGKATIFIYLKGHPYRAVILSCGKLIGQKKVRVWSFFFYKISKHFSLVAQMVKIHLQRVRPGFDPCGGKIPWRRAWQPTPVLLSRGSPWPEEPGGLQSMGSERVRHDWSAKHSTCKSFIFLYRNFNLVYNIKVQSHFPVHGIM